MIRLIIEDLQQYHFKRQRINLYFLIFDTVNYVNLVVFFFTYTHKVSIQYHSSKCLPKSSYTLMENPMKITFFELFTNNDFLKELRHFFETGVWFCGGTCQQYLNSYTCKNHGKIWETNTIFFIIFHDFL